MLDKILTILIALFAGMLASSLLAGIVLSLFSYIIPALGRSDFAWPLTSFIIFMAAVIYGFATKRFRF